MKLSKLLPACGLACAGIASGQGLYNIMPYDDDPVDSLPLHFTAGLNIGYDSNPSPILSDCSGFDSDGVMYGSAWVQGNFVSATPQTVMDIWARLGIIYYFDEIEQTTMTGTVGDADDTYYEARAGFNITHHVSERLRFRSRNNIAYEQEPDFDSGIASDRRQGQYFRYSSDNSVGYRWTERFGTVTGWRIHGTVWDDASDEDYVTNLFYNQFRYRTSPVTVLTGSVRYGFTDNDGGGDSDSFYLLGGIEHQFSPATVGVLRVGAQHFSPDHGSDSWSPYVESTIKTQVSAQFSVRAFLYYGMEGRNRNTWIHDCDALMTIPTDPARALYDERSTLRIGSQASYALSQELTLFGGVNVVFDNFEDGEYTNSSNFGMWTVGDSAPDLDEAIFNINLGASLQVTDNLYVTGSYNYSDSNSDADIRDYDRHRVQLGVQASF